MIEKLIFLLILTLPLGQLGRLPLPFSQVNIYLHDLVVLFLLFYWLKKKIGQREKFNLPPLGQPILSFIGAGVFSLILSIPKRNLGEIAVASLYILRWTAYAGIYFLVAERLKKKQNLKPRLNNFLMISGTVAVCLGILQYLLLPDIRSLMASGWDPHYYRIVGTYLDPGFTGMIYVLTLVLIITKLWSKREIMKNNSMSSNLSTERLKLLGMGGVVYLALALTYSRSSYLAYLIAMIVVAGYKKSKKFLAGVLIAGVLTVILLPRPGGEGVRLERQSTIWSRINNWRQSLIIGLDQPLCGVGFNNYRYVQRDYGFLEQENWRKTHAGAGADSSFLFILATTGVIGLMVYFWLIKEVLLLGRKSLALTASTVALIGHSFFNNSLFYSWLMIWWWILVVGNSKSE